MDHGPQSPHPPEPAQTNLPTAPRPEPEVPAVPTVQPSGFWRKLGRVFLATIGVTLVLTGNIFLGVWVGHLWQAVAWVSFGAGIVALASGVLAVRRARLHLARRGAVFRWAFIVLGTASLAFAAWNVAAGTHPYDPTLLDNHSTCGSVIQPRRFPSDFFGDVTGFSQNYAIEDCVNTKRTARGAAMAFGLLGVELAVLGLRRDPDRIRQHETRHPSRIGAVMGVLVLITVGVLAAQNAHQVRYANDYDRAIGPSLPASLRVLRSATKVALDIQDLVPAVKPKYDWPAISRVCTNVSRDTKKLVATETRVRKKIDLQFRIHADVLARDFGRLGDTCVKGAKARDKKAFKTTMVPLAKQIPKDIDLLQSAMAIR